MRKKMKNPVATHHPVEYKIAVLRKRLESCLRALSELAYRKLDANEARDLFDVIENSRQKLDQLSLLVSR